ncbi:MAG: MFS transporter [Lentisphaerales bacterium]|nr:MFS transporter [Lentisphaerales bacterium]
MELCREVRKQAHRNILLCQCAGLFGPQFLANGFMLNYLKKFELGDSAIMFLLTLIPYACNLIFLMPLAHLSDKFGKKRIGAAGNWLHALGFGLFGVIYFLPQQALLWATLAICLFSFGLTCFVSNWFALLHPLIEDHKRGHFFAWLRIAWQLICIVATFAVSLILAKYNSKLTYLWIIGIVTFFLVYRIWFYVKVPDVTEKNEVKPDFKNGLRDCFQNREYIAFCIFIGVFMFFCSGFLTFANLYEKESLKFSESKIVTMGYLAQLGALIGYWLGAKVADEKKNILMFRGNLMLSAAAILLFSCMAHFTSLTVITAGALTLLFSVAFNSMGIGVTTEAMRLVKAENRSLGISISMAMTAAGASLCGLCSSIYLAKAGSLSFSLAGMSFNHYQIYLLFCSAGLLLLFLIYSLKKNRTI